MVSIPKSPGVVASPFAGVNVATRRDTGGTQIARAVGGLGQTIETVGVQKLQQQEEQRRREREAFQAANFVDFKNQLRRFDDAERLQLDEAPANLKTISGGSGDILERRNTFIEDFLGNFADDTDLQATMRSHAETSSVGFEDKINTNLSKKKRQYGRDKIFEGVFELKDKLRTADPDELGIIGADLQELMQVGFASGLVNRDDIERQEEAFRKIGKERMEELERAAIFAAAMDGSMVLDSRRKDDRDIIDDHFAKLLAKGNVDAKQLGEHIATVTGIIPTEMKRNLSGKLKVGSNEEKLEVSESIGALIKDNAKLQDNFPASDLAQIYAINSRAALGLPVDDIVEFAEEEIRKNKDQDRLLREADFNKKFGSTHAQKSRQKKIRQITNELEDESGIWIPFISKEAEAPPQLANEVISLTRDFYLNDGMDMEAAEDRAIDVARKNWAVTNIGQKRYQKFAPEANFKDIKGINHSEWIEDQSLKEINKFHPEITKGGFTLDIKPETLVKEDRERGYYVTIEEDSGILDFLRNDKNEPIVITPDVTKAEFYTKDNEARDRLRLTDDKIDEARRIRDDIGSKEASKQQRGINTSLRTLIR